MGVGKALKENNPMVKIVSAHPVRGHYIQGLKNMEEAIVPEIYDPREIIKKEGFSVGMSSGAAMYAALEIAKKIKSGTIIVIFPDRGEKYLSTNLFSGE